MGKRGPPPGTPKTPGSGRQAGTPNKKTQELQAAVVAGGITPLEYMLSVMRDEKATQSRRDWGAVSAAPYVHPKLASTELAGKDGQPLIPTVVRVPHVEPDAKTWQERYAPKKGFEGE